MKLTGDDKQLMLIAALTYSVAEIVGGKLARERQDPEIVAQKARNFAKYIVRFGRELDVLLGEKKEGENG